MDIRESTRRCVKKRVLCKEDCSTFSIHCQHRLCLCLCFCFGQEEAAGDLVRCLKAGVDQIDHRTIYQDSTIVFTFLQNVTRSQGEESRIV